MTHVCNNAQQFCEDKTLSAIFSNKKEVLKVRHLTNLIHLSLIGDNTPYFPRIKKQNTKESDNTKQISYGSSWAKENWFSSLSPKTNFADSTFAEKNFSPKIIYSRKYSILPK